MLTYCTFAMAGNWQLCQHQCYNEKSAQRDANTACQKFLPRRRPPSRGRRTAKI